MRNFFLKSIIMIVFAAISIFGWSSERKTVDFDFPQQVSADALKDLKSALKSNDGEGCVDAIIRYSLAQGQVSGENMDGIVDKIEEVIGKEPRPQYRALLRYFEAIVFKSYMDDYGVYGRKNPEGELPEDYTEWDNAQFKSKIEQLVGQALADKQVLQQEPITGYKRIIEQDEEATTYIPTLFAFLSRQCIELLDDRDGPLVSEIYDNWEQSVEGNVPATIFVKAMRDDSDFNIAKLYNQYSDNEHSGLLLEKLYNKSHYDTFKGYVMRYPGSKYSNAIRNKITDIEQRKATTDSRSNVSSRDSIHVTVNYQNTSHITVSLYRVPDAMALNRKLNEYQVKKLDFIESQEINLSKTIPFDGRTDVKFGPQRCGNYIAIASYELPDGTIKNLTTVRANSAIEVRDLHLISVETDDKTLRIIALDTKTGNPLKGVTIKTEKKEVLGQTGDDGILKTDRRNHSATLYGTIGDSPYASSLSYYPSRFTKESEADASIFTDLAIYRPGETINASAIVYHRKTDDRSVMAGMKVRMRFYDANDQKLQEDTLVTDEFGRVNTSFKVPEGRLNGRFSILLYYGNRSLAYKDVNVSEYKLPTFSVDMRENKRCFNADEPVTITGKIETYSGMPLADAEVKLTLTRKVWSWRWFHDTSTGELMNDTTVRTDADGKFSFFYPSATFGDKYYGSFCVKAVCTNSAGETQEGETRFVLGHRRGLEITDNDLNFINDKPITLPVVLNSTNESETSVRCAYTLVPAGSEFNEANIVAQGTFASDKPEIDLTGVKSGKYTIKVEIEGDASAEKDRATLILYRLSDNESPAKNEAMWVPTSGRKVDEKNVAHITIGTDKPESHIYYVATSRTKVEAQGWLHYKPGLHTLILAIPEKPDELLRVTLYCTHDYQSFTESVTLIPDKNRQGVELKVTSFRDRLVPGDKEKWTFRLEDRKGTGRRGAVLLALTNKAVDDLAHNQWSLYVPYISYQPFSVSGNYLSNNYVWQYNNWAGMSLSTYSFEDPELYLYNLSSVFVGRMMYEDALLASPMAGSGRMGVMRMAKKSNVALMTEDGGETADSYEANDEAMDMSEGEIADRAALDNVAVREGDVKTALWKPMLVTDANGDLAVEFDVPATNSTWIMQALAYSSDMLTSIKTRETMTQKPIMVKPSVPRFVRQGDHSSLAGVIQNATDEAKECDAVIELFDPRTGGIVSTRTFHDIVEPRGTKPVSIEWAVTDTLPFIGFRIKAATGNFGDGEQVMIPILTSISPVIETKPFYIDAATPRFAFNLPQFTSDARVTLEYCDNPVWYCVTALPTIFDKNYGLSTILAHNLFAISVARSVAKSQPNIKEATEYWLANKQDSTLVSMLSRNADLKIGTLLASPWVSEAERQTLRMSKIGELFDEEKMDSEIDKIVQSLQSLQMSDGGWTWFLYPGCKSSLYTTGTVLELIGEVKHIGLLIDDARVNDMAARAIGYFDREYLRLYKEQLKEDKNNHSGFSNYVYVRSLFPEVKVPKDNADMIKKCLKAMTKDWKGTSMGNKAFYALALNNHGEEKVAKSIIQSIREFAITKPATGTYWDNLTWGWNDKVGVTAVILNAMAEVDPRTEEIDNVRKWLLLNKQSNDWGGSSLAAHAVYSLLSSGSKWLERNGKPQIAIGGKLLEVDKADEYLGYFRREIEAQSGAEVVITRNGASPAWGSIYSQFRAPMTTIEQVSIDDLWISKEYYVYGSDGTLKPVAEFHVGDKIQVRTIIKANKDLEYVTVTDERASCFEPVDQISGYRYADHTYYYLETKDAATNLFFNYIGKGTKVISYDVYVTAQGEYNAGIATAQCQYAPQITAHSAGRAIVVK